jgi:hypothetical protein
VCCSNARRACSVWRLVQSIGWCQSRVSRLASHSADCSFAEVLRELRVDPRAKLACLLRSSLTRESAYQGVPRLQFHPARQVLVASWCPSGAPSDSRHAGILTSCIDRRKPSKSTAPCVKSRWEKCAVAAAHPWRGGYEACHIFKSRRAGRFFRARSSDRTGRCRRAAPAIRRRWPQ